MEPGQAIGAAPRQRAGRVYNWTVPAGVTSISVVTVVGGGGGLGNSGSGDAGGGAGGGLAYKNDIAVTPGATMTVVVGAGGAAKFATSGNAKGNDGALSKIAIGGSDVFGAGGGKGNSRDGAVNVYGFGGGAAPRPSRGAARGGVTGPQPRGTFARRATWRASQSRRWRSAVMGSSSTGGIRGLRAISRARVTAA